MFRDNEVTSVFVYSRPVEAENLTLQASEVDEVRWFSLHEVWDEIQSDRSRFCVPRDGLGILKAFLEKKEV